VRLEANINAKPAAAALPYLGAAGGATLGIMMGGVPARLQAAQRALARPCPYPCLMVKE
jgi:hypothetical protein